MAKKKQETEKKKINTDGIMGLHGSTTEQAISETLEVNYMPYAMSVIVSRAIPEIDGFKPSHRKLLYAMYKMGLLTGSRTKSANIVGQTMRLNPHGDAAIYETMVRLSRGNETLLHPFVDSKGNFGKVFSNRKKPTRGNTRRNRGPDSGGQRRRAPFPFARKGRNTLRRKARSPSRRQGSPPYRP